MLEPCRETDCGGIRPCYSSQSRRGHWRGTASVSSSSISLILKGFTPVSILATYTGSWWRTKTSDGYARDISDLVERLGQERDIDGNFEAGVSSTNTGGRDQLVAALLQTQRQEPA